MLIFTASKAMRFASSVNFKRRSPSGDSERRMGPSRIASRCDFRIKLLFEYSSSNSLSMIFVVTCCLSKMSKHNSSLILQARLQMIQLRVSFSFTADMELIMERYPIYLIPLNKVDQIFSSLIQLFAACLQYGKELLDPLICDHVSQKQFQTSNST